MKKLIAAIMVVMLAGCEPTTVEGHWIKTAQKACENNAGLYSISYSTNAMFKITARCEDGSIKSLSE